MSLSLLLATSAHAFLYGGNPAVRVFVQRPAGDLVSGSVELQKVTVHPCAGGYTDYAVGEVIDPVEGYTVQIAGGDLCGLRFWWASDMELDGDGTLGAFSLLYGEAYTNISIDPDIVSVALTPYDLVSGSMTSGAPRLSVTID
jgi:hypothetical protein